MQEKVINTDRFEFDRENKVFRKFLDVDKFNSELEMSKLAAELSLKNKLFNTPEIKHIDPKKHILEFELLNESVTLRQFFISQAKFGTSKKQFEELQKLFYRVGQSIAIFHNNTKNIKSVSVRTFPKDFFETTFNSEHVFIHGDFTLRNILYSKDTDRLDLIDWNTSPLFEFSANFGPRYWDLSFFISSLFYYSYSTFFSSNLRVQLSKYFLDGYLVNSDLDNEFFINELSQFLHKYSYYKLYKKILFHKRSPSEMFLIKRTQTKLDRFSNILPSLFQF